MKSFCFLLCLIPLSSTHIWAFEGCQLASANPTELASGLRATAIRDSPVKYLEMARAITILTTAFGNKLLPFASQQGASLTIVFPPKFAEVLCEIVLTQFLLVDDAPKAAYNQAVLQAAQCFDNTGDKDRCLVTFASRLSQSYTPMFAASPERNRETALGLYETVQRQVVSHEYAHHYLNHFARIGQGTLARPDAEFEADRFAVLNGIQQGEPETATYYFFQPLADIESHTTKPLGTDYESGQCRAANIMGVTSFLGTAPLVVLDAAFGREGGSKDPIALFRSAAEKLNKKPVMPPGSCSRVAAVPLQTLFDEQKKLYTRISADTDLLYSKEKVVDTKRAKSLMKDISQMAVEFQQLQGMAAEALALIVRQWGLKDRELKPLTDEIDHLLADPNVYGNFLSLDYGRLLQAQGLSMVQERTDLPAETRLTRSFDLLHRAVYYNDAQTESWANLAMVAFMQSDCSSAAHFMERSVETFTGSKEDLDKTYKPILVYFRKVATDPQTCRVEGPKAHFYPGL